MKKIILSLTIIFFGIVSMAQPVNLLKSVFIYNFANMIEWPQESKTGDFIIGVIGGSGVKGELEKMAASKKVGSQTIVVKHFSSAAEVSSCHIVLVSNDKKGELANVLSKKDNTLIISEEGGAAKKGAGISFVLVSGKIKFELNKKNVVDSGLKVGGSLEKLAILVE